MTTTQRNRLFSACMGCSVVMLLTFTLRPTPSRGELIGYWPLDGHLKDAAPLGEKADHGRFVGGTKFGPGKFGKAIVLDGTNFVTIPNSRDLDATNEPITLVAWFRLERWNVSWQTLLAKGEGDRFRIARWSGSLDLAFSGGYVDGSRSDIMGGDLNDREWHHLVAITGGDSPQMFFIDGKLLGVSQQSPILGDRGTPLLLGANPEVPEGRHWVGAIDDVGLFSEALGAAEARALWTFATGKRFGYDLGQTARLIRLHREESSRAEKVGNSSWKFVPSAPADETPFVQMSDSGSGVAASLKPAILTFEAANAYIKTGSTATLHWKVSEDATEVRIRPTTGSVRKRSGTMSVSPSEDTEYQILARNKHGTSMATVTVYVDYPFATPRISEFVADSGGEFLDEDGEAGDWIEIENPEATIARLGGLYLTDDDKKPTQWALPERFLKPGERVVVFASGKDRRATTGPTLHANFKLRAEGEYLALIEKDGESTVVLSSFGKKYPKQQRGTSYGATPRGEIGFLASPTPGAKNSELAGEPVQRVQFSSRRSIQNAPFELTLSTATKGASIYFTMDGSLPSPVNSAIYTRPIPIRDTTVVRAIATKRDSDTENITNLDPETTFRISPVETHTFLFPERVARQSVRHDGFPRSWNNVMADYAMDPRIANDPAYRDDLEKGLRALPSVSLSLPMDDLFGKSGIYVNPMQSGRDWERAASMEFIQADGTTGFQVDCGLRIQGGFGRNTQFLKHSLRVLFKRNYGETKLVFPMFPGTQAVRSFDTLTLRAGFNNSWHRRVSREAERAQYLRDEFMRRSQLAMGQPSSHGRFVHVYLNGLYWGLYNIVERPSAAFAASYLGGSKDDYDALNSGEAIDGNVDVWIEAQRLASTGDVEALWAGIHRFVNLENLIDYILLNVYGGNFDWDHHNWYGARKREDGAGYHFFSWDAERTLEGLDDDSSKRNNHGNPTAFFHALLRHPAFKRMVSERVQKHFFGDGALTPKNTAARYAALAREIEDAIVAESARWGDSQQVRPYSRDRCWITERDRLLSSYFPMRTNVVLEQLNAARYIAYVKPPRLRLVGDAFHLIAELGTVYYTTDGSDPRQPDGTPNPKAEAIRGASGASTILPQGAEWRYLDDGSNQGTEWRHARFDDSKWKTGKARFGYGGDGEATTISYGPDANNKYVTTYFRCAFEMREESFDDVKLLVARDDGVVMYLNGVEIGRSNVPGSKSLSYRAYASSSVSPGAEHRFHEFSVPPERFNSGTNHIAVELHQGSPTTSDAGFDLIIQGVKLVKRALTEKEADSLKARALHDGTWSALSSKAR